MPVASTEQDSARLSAELHRVFGHREFRPHQQQVCEAAVSGRDVLLVMPTGAGKSLCYQLPALVRGQGAALVVSPLIALMDDQAGKLESLGVRVARIHSGLGRDHARQACRAYLDGQLDFLFIAPERMRVPGFAEMLAKRTPSLVAIDEAHCISQWGHDFRPDYRTLGGRLPGLRPAPILALTATATPTVQRDIVAQLNLVDPAVFITGFRRHNLAVEAIELSKPQRPEFVAKLLREPTARPAIVYASSRKAAEELAERLNKDFPARTYHAGLEPSVRERVQREFLAGKVEVVVATVAFGMGVDKADVRTVVHIALPGSVEAYYQEIGRAGRDGQPSRTVLLYSFADRKTLEFLLEKSYPAVGDLERVQQMIASGDGDYFSVDTLQRSLRMERETVERSLEKLFGNGLAEVNMNDEVRAVAGSGANGWRKNYEAQVNARRDQIDRVIAYAEGHTCRMLALVRHFGDATDTAGPCGKCDVCDPRAGVRSGNEAAGHAPDAGERAGLRSLLRAIEGRGQSTGKLFTELKLCRERKDFDLLLEGLARAGLLVLENDTFRTPEGRDVTYRKAVITHEGREPDDATLATVWLRGGAAAQGKTAAARTRRAEAKIGDAVLTPEARALEAQLKAWRAALAKENGVPAFTVMHDATLRAIATANPRTLSDLRQVHGMGGLRVEKVGAAVLAVCRGEAVVAEASHPPGLKPVPFKTGSDASKPVPFSKSTAREPVAVAPMLAAELDAAQAALEENLKQWRRETARKAGLPTFFILSDTALREVVMRKPADAAELRGVRGVGADKVERYGADVLALCR